MKRTFIAVFVAGLLGISCGAFAQCPGDSDRNVIVTEGVGEVTGQNDSAKISIAVLTEGKNLERVSSENAEKTNTLIKAVKGLDVKNLKVETSGYRVTPQKDYKARPPQIKGYQVFNAIQVTLEGFEPEHLSGNVSKIIGRALESGANDVSQIQFYIKNKAPLEKEAITQATQEAIDRATTLANAAGVKLKRIVSLSTHPIHVPPTPMLRAAEMRVQEEAMAPPIEAGESQIRARVSIVYEIE